MSPGGTDVETDPDRRRMERLVLLVLAAVQFTTLIDFMIVMPLGPQLQTALNLDPEQFSRIVSSYTFAAGAAGLITSALVDRFDRRKAFLAMFSGFLIGTLCCALAPTYRLLLAARVVTGACGGIVGGMSMAIIGDLFPEDRRGRATSALMTGFALASVAGVPFGLELGNRFGWHIPFIALVALGAPVLVLAIKALPPLRGHLGRPHTAPWKSLRETFAEPNHLNAFALTVTLMVGSFTVVPFISTYLVANVGMTNEQLPMIYIAGGALTLIASPPIGRWADRYGKLRMYRLIAPLSALMLLIITHLPPTYAIVAAAAVGLLMVFNAGRMIAAQAMITSSVAPHRRGGFLSANASVQHIATGLGTSLGGRILSQATPTSPLLHYGTVGWIACATTLATLWLAGRIRVADEGGVAAEPLSLAAAAEATADVGEPMIGA
jgi:predicted MFS family arabinose efflux permease